MTDLMRQGFENHPSFVGMDFSRVKDFPNYYDSPYANGAWEGWQEGWNAALGLKDVNNLQYKIGDTLWFANGGEKLTEGKVVHIFGWGATVQYVLEYNAVIDYHVVCRNGLCVSENPEGPLNLSKLAKEAGINIKKRLEERGIK